MNALLMHHGNPGGGGGGVGREPPDTHSHRPAPARGRRRGHRTSIDCAPPPPPSGKQGADDHVERAGGRRLSSLEGVISVHTVRACPSARGTHRTLYLRLTMCWYRLLPRHRHREADRRQTSTTAYRDTTFTRGAARRRGQSSHPSPPLGSCPQQRLGAKRRRSRRQPSRRPARRPRSQQSLRRLRLRLRLRLRRVRLAHSPSRWTSRSLRRRPG
jgi:hypothetical protein